MNRAKAVEPLSCSTEDEDNAADIETILDELTLSTWESDEEFARFFIQASVSMTEGLDGGSAIIFGHEITYSFYPGTSIWNLWTKAHKMREQIDQICHETGCISEETKHKFKITSIFNLIPAALKESYDTQSLGE